MTSWPSARASGNKPVSQKQRKTRRTISPRFLFAGHPFSTRAPQNKNSGPNLRKTGTRLVVDRGFNTPDLPQIRILEINILHFHTAPFYSFFVPLLSRVQLPIIIHIFSRNSIRQPFRQAIRILLNSVFRRSRRYHTVFLENAITTKAGSNQADREFRIFRLRRQRKR